MFATPQETEDAFYEALEHADLARLMQVFADDEEVVCIHPGGLRLVGQKAVEESWQAILASGPLHIRPMRPVIMHSMGSAVHILVEHVGSSATGSRDSFISCYATNVYHKGPAGWRMVMHHASAAPAEAGLVDLHDVPDMLH
jgi:ketosteroid isomerase-like protein